MKARQALSNDTDASLSVEINDYDLDEQLNREDFNNTISPITEALEAFLRNALA